VQLINISVPRYEPIQFLGHLTQLDLLTSHRQEILIVLLEVVPSVAGHNYNSFSVDVHIDRVLGGLTCDVVAGATILFGKIM